MLNKNIFLLSESSPVANKPVNNYNNYNYKTTPSAPRLGGSFGSYYDGKGNFHPRRKWMFFFLIGIIII